MGSTESRPTRPRRRPRPGAGVELQRPFMPSRKSLDRPRGFPHPLQVSCHETLLIYMKQIHCVNRKDFRRLLALGLLCGLVFITRSFRVEAGDSPTGSVDASPELRGLAAEVRSKGWIVYSSQSGAGDWDLFVMRPDGSARRNLTQTREFNEAGTRFSPDGSRLL